MPFDGVRRVSFLTVDRPALVLGSTQPDDAVDRDAAAAAGVDVVRRRSGGGAVLLRRREVVWANVLVPRDDPLWDDDVGRAFHWLGQAWSEALASLGLAARWHEGPLVRSPLSRTVCFAGLGPGEVTIDGRKVVGMAQRRTRAGALFQCAVALVWEPAALLDLLVLDDDARANALAELEATAAGTGLDAPAVEDALVAHLPG